MATSDPLAKDAAPAPVGKNPESDVETGHDYDGIREYDNRLPNWWLGVLILSIVFGYGYFFYYHVFDRPGLWAKYQAESAEYAAAQLRVPVDDKTIMELAGSAPEKVGAVFQGTCSPCHGPKGEGKIGPNLTDGAWLHGGKPAQIYETIAKGVVTKGMPAWGPQLGAEKTKLLAAYVVGQLKGKNVAGKPPEGQPE